jgi:hypothetical protein
MAYGRVAAASGVVKERLPTIGRAAGTGCVEFERLRADCCVLAASGVVNKSERTTGRVVGSGGVA